ncbi:MAG: virginiamycin B lyase family protein [Nitrosopumilaceae archaeon]
MKKKIKTFVVAAFFGVILLTSALAISLNTNVPTQPIDTTITGTPADNYPDAQRATYCGTGVAKSNRYITEFKIPTVCAQPLAITTDPSGTVWFTETNTGMIAKFDPFSRLFTEYENTKWPKGSNTMMWGIGHTSDGNIWFTDPAHDAVWKFSISEKNYTSFRYPVSQGTESFPQKIVIDDKTILVNDFTGNKITLFDSTQSGEEITYSKIAFPVNDTNTGALTIDSQGKIWYTVWKFQQGGNLVFYDPKASNGTGFNLPLGMNAPNGISASSDGKMWITDAASSLFFSFDPQSQKFTKFITSMPRESTYGNSTGVIKTPISRPYWNSFDEKGRLWFNEQTANIIAVFDPAKESLVEYFVPSQNPRWADCGNSENCGIAQVLDFTISEDKIWFTEWVENNIGVLDSSIMLPIEVNVEPKELTLERGDTANLSLTITPNEQLDRTISLTTANTASPNDIILSGLDQKIAITNQPQTISLNVSIDKFALSGTYKLLVGAQYQEIAVSEFVTITVK